VDNQLSGAVALVTGATRGAGRGMAIELGAAGATVYVTGRTTRDSRSPVGRAETIEDTAELVTKAGGRGIAVRCDHTDPGDVAKLASRITAEQDGRLDVLVNDTWGADQWIEWKPLWEHDLDNGLRALRNGLETQRSPCTPSCRCSCAADAGWSARSPTATTCSTPATAAPCSSTSSKSPSRA
jgi:hypothetical protein